MKIAIVCDWLVTIGGAEKILGEIIQCFPEADLFSVIDFIPDNQRGFLLNKKSTTTFIQKLPLVKNKYRHYLPLMPLAIEQLELSKYDVIISSSHAVAKGVITGPDQVHISYVHSPMRYIWELQHEYLRDSGLDKKLSGHIARYFLHKMRMWDLRSAMGVDHFIANSNFISKRIQKNYRRASEVIYPCVELNKFEPFSIKEDYYFAVSRLVPYKKIELIVESFSLMPDKKLLVIGDGPHAARIKEKAGKNVTILGYQPNEVVVHYMQRAKALIFPSIEDFGITPLEAQACGTPVIAFGQGGALETVKGIDADKPTGIFFLEQSTRAIIDAIKQFENNYTLCSLENCVSNASRFSPEIFREKFKSFILNTINNQ